MMTATKTIDLLAEEWRMLSDSKDYEVSTLGRVRRRGKLLKQLINLGGYPAISVAYVVGKRRTRTIHSLVMEVFVGPRPDGMVVAHRDGVRTNNRLGNLRYCTQTENRADDVANGTRPRGIRHGSAKLTPEAVRAIRASDEPSRDLARRYGVDWKAVRKVRTGETWRHVQ